MITKVFCKVCSTHNTTFSTIWFHSLSCKLKECTSCLFCVCHCILRIVNVRSLHCSILVYKSLHFLPIFLENYFSNFFWVFCVFCLFCIEFGVSFIHFLTLHNHCIHSSRCQVLCVFILTYFKQFVKTDIAS